MVVARRVRNRALHAIVNLERSGYSSQLTLENPAFKNLPGFLDALDVLEDLGLVRVNHTNTGIHSFSTTSEGYVHFERRSDDIWLFIRHSILVPVGVSILTTGLTWCVKYLITGSWL